ncbi:MAG: sensor domain-containing diguanylate cyclase [Gammaproteobacteria bacterium]
MSQAETPISPAVALQILESLPIGIFVADDSGTIIWANDALCSQLAVTYQSTIGKSRDELPVNRILTLFKTVEAYQLPGTPGHPERWLNFIARHVQVEPGQAFEVACVVDVTHYEIVRKRKHLNLISAALNETDPDTGLLTQHSVMAQLVSEVSRSRRYNNDLTVFMINLVQPAPDHSSAKSGCAAALAQTARFLKERLRWVDIIGHWGGSSILVVLPETNLESATQLAGKLRAEMDKSDVLEWARDPAADGLAINLGVTAWKKGDDAVSLTNRASNLLIGDPPHGAATVSVV